MYPRSIVPDEKNIKHHYIKYMLENCGLGSDKYSSFKYFPKISKFGLTKRPAFLSVS